jgi:inosose dehydratase
MPELGADNTFEQCISEMALAGFKGTEIGNKYPKNTEKLRKALIIRDLEIASAWFSSFITTNPFEETLASFIEHRDFLHQMGARVIVVSEQGHSIQGNMNVPLFGKKPVFSADDWEKLLKGLNRLGELALERGMKLVYHHHMGTGVQTTDEIDRLMEMTDSEKVYLLYDSGHLFFSGEDPLYVLRKYFDRIKHVHLKDVRVDVAGTVRDRELSFLQAVKEGVFTVPGDGAIDFRPIFKFLANHDYEGWLLVEAEQDPEKANPLKYAMKARNYIKETSGF